MGTMTIAFLLLLFVVQNMGVNSYDPGVERCTALAIGKDATTSGAVMISHGECYKPSLQNIKKKHLH